MNFLKDISKTMSEAQDKMTSESFMQVSVSLSHNKDDARETIQEVTSQSIKDVIGKLEKGSQLTAEELDCVRLWIIGDAEGYTEMENDFQEWLKEYRRLATVLAGYENRPIPTKELVKVHGVLEDAVRVSADIGNFLEKKERIKKFEDATRDFVSLDKEVLKHILESKLNSTQM
ncbi:MAG: hypothetical protein JSW40_08000 [Candidatus Omnitrophota bacterium]|nr:MAG: hypothetical protein JSW40_08000 [Candidatus Omnitrophota bacterium]